MEADSHRTESALLTTAVDYLSCRVTPSGRRCRLLQDFIRPLTNTFIINVQDDIQYIMNYMSFQAGNLEL